MMWLESERAVLTQFLHYREMFSMQEKMERCELKKRTPSTSWRHVAGMKSTQPRQSVSQRITHSNVFNVFMFHSSAERPPSSNPCLHLPLGFLCRWLASRRPSGTPGDGTTRQESVGQKGCERLLSVWLESLMRHVVGFLSNHNPPHPRSRHPVPGERPQAGE